MEYTFFMDPNDDKYLLLKFLNMVFKEGEVKIYSRV